MKQIIIFVFLLCSIVWADDTPLKVDNEYKTDLYYSTDILFTVDEDEEEAVWTNQVEDLIKTGQTLKVYYFALKKVNIQRLTHKNIYTPKHSLGARGSLRIKFVYFLYSSH